VREAAPGRWELQGISQDVTALAEARDAALMGELAAKEAADVKSRFLRTMSHEVRTPLNGVLGALHILRTSAQAEEDAKLIDHALNCGAILAKLLDDVVDLSALEAQQLELFPEPVDPEGILRGVCDLLRPHAEAKGLAFSVEATPLKKPVRLDGGRLRQILFNLIANAVKFTVSGSVSIRQTSRLTGDDQRIRIEVEDTGVGVASGAEAFIFEGFSQADGSFTRAFGGAGLGLAISRRIATLMGGEIGVRSQEDRGSTFWVELPAPVVCAASPSQAAREDALLGVSILVVDDNATNRVIARTLLEILGADVDTAEDGAQAVLAARQRAYDVIFMDIQMPILDGVEATRRIKRNEGANQSTPIVAMTANTLPEQLRAYREAGMAGCLAKPLSPLGILGAVRDARGGGADLAATG
jgi:CheY-like chemotaxis protein